MNKILGDGTGYYKVTITRVTATKPQVLNDVTYVYLEGTWLLLQIGRYVLRMYPLSDVLNVDYSCASTTVYEHVNDLRIKGNEHYDD